MSSIALAEFVPLWLTLRQEGVMLITPALDYVGGLELSPVDVRFAHEEHITSLREALRSFVGSLDDGCCLLFLYRVAGTCDEDVGEYEDACAQAQPSALKQYIASRASEAAAVQVDGLQHFVQYSRPQPASETQTTARIPSDANLPLGSTARRQGRQP